MTFLDESQIAAEDTFIALGDPATYFRGTESVISCTVQVDSDMTFFADGYDSQIAENSKVLSALISEVGRPRKGDNFIIGDDNYTVAKLVRSDEIVVALLVK